METYVNGLLSDIDSLKNAIKYKYNNVLAEGSVNKIKLTKRIMYGRNSFELLKAKLLLNESKRSNPCTYKYSEKFAITVIIQLHKLYDFNELYNSYNVSAL